MTTWGFSDHAAFQRAGILLVGLGGAVGALAGWVALGGSIGSAPADGLLVLVVGLAATKVALAEPRRPGPGRIARSGGVVLGLALAWITWQALVDPQGAERWLVLENATAGALFGLVAALGLLPAHLTPLTPDPVAAALGAALARLGSEREPGEEHALVQRAAAAHARTCAGLSGHRSAGARDLREGAGALTLRVIDLAGRCQELRHDLRTVDATDLAGRSAALAQAAGVTDDPAARDDFARAARTSAELQERVRTLRAAHDRLRARLSLQVTILESTALALSTHRASSIADQAASLGPLAERVREAGADLEARSLALAETAS